MKEFAHFQGQFKSGWKGPENKAKREDLFAQLIGVILATKAQPIGSIISVPDFHSLSQCQQQSFKDPYYVAFQNCTRGAALEAFRLESGKVAMVYSYNQEFGAVVPQEIYSADQAGKAEQLWHAMKNGTDFGRWMGTYASNTPVDTVQLQAADILAYELAKEFENLIVCPDDEMRWGLEQLLGLAKYPFPRITLFDKQELLRIVKVNRFPCQTGTELVDVDWVSPWQSALKWMHDRGKFPRKIDADKF